MPDQHVTRRYYLRLGLLGFGGPVALVGQMERELASPSASWFLGRRGRWLGWLQWLIAVAAFGVTVVVEAEVAWIFIVAGLVGVAYYAPGCGRAPRPRACR
jgi:chromate transport protein ChrA